MQCGRGDRARGEVGVSHSLVGIITPSGLELEKMLKETDGCRIITLVKIENADRYRVPSLGARGIIAWNGCLACLANGDLIWISGCVENQ